MYTIRLNKDDNLIFNIFEFNVSDFNADPVIKIQSDDLRNIKDVFADINNIEIYESNKIIADYSIYDSYSDISYIDKMFDAKRKMFVSCLAVRLSKTNLAEQVQRLDKQLNPVVDEDNMTIEELKERRIKQISKDGEDDIFSGDEVTFEDGTTKTYTFGLDDQNNLQTYLSLIAQIPDKSKIAIPYHAIGEICQNYTAKQIVEVYFTLQVKLLRVYTYVNMLRLYINSLNDIEQVKNIHYGTILPQQYQDQMNMIMSESIDTIMEIKEQYDFDYIEMDGQSE